MRLRPLPAGRFYCGPAAIASIKGEHPKELIRALINRERGRPDNRGVCRTNKVELMAVMTKLGWSVEWAEIDGRPTLVLWWKKQADTGLYIVNVASHLVAVADGHACDSVSRIPKPVDVHPSAGRRVKGYMILFQLST